MEVCLPPTTLEVQEVLKEDPPTADSTVTADDHIKTEITHGAIPTAIAEAVIIAPTAVPEPVVITVCADAPTTEITAAPVVESVSINVSPTAAATQMAVTSANSKQIQQKEQSLQHLNMAKDWDASDIEKKLAENSTLLTQWSAILEKNG
jgi:hypothetical protein